MLTRNEEDKSVFANDFGKFKNLVPEKIHCLAERDSNRRLSVTWRSALDRSTTEAFNNKTTKNYNEITLVQA